MSTGPWKNTRVLTAEEEELALELAIQGQSLTLTAKKLGFNGDMAFFKYRQRHPDFSKRLENARDAACDHLEDSMLTVSDDYESAHHARIKLDALGKVLGYRKPNRYGNKVDVTMTQTVDIGASLERMQARLDATYRDVTPQVAIVEKKILPDSEGLW